MSGPERYDAVPAELPATLPPIARADAARVATAVYRRFRPRVPGSNRGPARYAESRVRRVWISREPTASTNHDKGVGRLIHDLSHRIFDRVYPHKRPHDPLHAKYETDVAAFVAERLDRLVKPPRVPVKLTTAEKRARRLARVEELIDGWIVKERRARNAVKKLAAERKRITRALAKDTAS